MEHRMYKSFEELENDAEVVGMAKTLLEISKLCEVDRFHKDDIPKEVILHWYNGARATPKIERHLLSYFLLYYWRREFEKRRREYVNKR